MTAPIFLPLRPPLVGGSLLSHHMVEVHRRPFRIRSDMVCGGGIQRRMATMPGMMAIAAAIPQPAGVPTPNSNATTATVTIQEEIVQTLRCSNVMARSSLAGAAHAVQDSTPGICELCTSVRTVTIAKQHDGVMRSISSLFLTVALIVGAQAAAAEDLAKYRVFALESSLASVMAASGARASDVRTLHDRPARIQELEWRAPYASRAETGVDPVRAMTFSFYNDSLYLVIVNYDRDRTEGLTNQDIIESISTTYGAPVLATARTRGTPPAEAAADSVVLAQWETADSRLTLVRGSYMPDYQLILISKSLSALARTAVRESVKLDAIEAPSRAAEQRKKEAGDAAVALHKARVANKAAFRP